MGIFSGWSFEKLKKAWDDVVEEAKHPMKNPARSWGILVQANREALRPIFSLLGFNPDTTEVQKVLYARAFPDENFPAKSSYLQAIEKGISCEWSTIGDALKEQIATGLQPRVRAYASYGKTNYFYGLPLLEYVAVPIHKDKFMSLVQLDLSDKRYTLVQGEYSVRIPSLKVWGLRYLQSTLGYTNKCSLVGGNYIYHSCVYEGGETKVSIVNTSEPTDIITYTIPGIKGNSYYQYIGTVSDGLNQFTYVFLYEVNTTDGTESTSQMCSSSIIDPLHEGTPAEDIMDLSDTLPIVPLKRKFAYNEEGMPEYESSKRMLSFLGLGLDDLVQGFKGSGEDELIGEIFFISGISIYDDRDSSSKYLYNFFKTFSSILQSTRVDSSRSNGSKAVPPTRQREESYSNYQKRMDNWKKQYENTFTVKYRSGEYNISIVFRSPESTIHTGKKCKVGQVVRVKSEDVYRDDPNAVTAHKGSGGFTHYRKPERSYITFHKQISSTQYESLRIYNITTSIDITHPDGTVKACFSALSYLRQEENADMIIPISRTFMNHLGPEEYERTILSSFHFVMFARNQTYLDYWQTAQFQSFMQFIMLIIMIVWTVWTVGADGGALGKLLLKAIVAAAIRELAKRMRLSNTELAIVMVAYAIFTSDGSSFNSFGVTALGSIEVILQCVTALSTVYVAHTKDEKEDLLEDKREAEEKYASHKKQIDDIIDSLPENQEIDYLDINRIEKIPYGTANDYLSRSLNSETAELALSYPDLSVRASVDVDALLYKTI